MAPDTELSGCSNRAEANSGTLVAAPPNKLEHRRGSASQAAFNGDCGHAPEVLVALSPALVERCRHIVTIDVSATFMREGRRHRVDKATNIARSISPTIFRFDGSEKRANDFCPSSATKLVAFWPQETWNAERFQHLRELAERRHCKIQDVIFSISSLRARLRKQNSITKTLQIVFDTRSPKNGRSPIRSDKL